MADWEISLCLPPIISIKTCGRLGNIHLLTTNHKYQDMWQIGKYPFAYRLSQVSRHVADWEISLCLPPITSIKTCGRLGNIPLLTTYHKYQDMWQIGKHPFAYHQSQVLRHVADWEISLCLPPITSIKTCGRLGNIPLLTVYHKYQDMWQIGKYPFAYRLSQVSRHVADREISLCLPPITSIKTCGRL